MTIDLAALERDYRSNTLSGREVAKRHDISEAYLRKLIKKHGWKRDLSGEIRRATQIMLFEKEGGEAKEQKEQEIVAHGAKLRSEVLLHHRRDIKIGRNTVELLLCQLLDASGHVESIEQEIIEATAGDRSTNRRYTMLTAVSLQSRAGVAEKLASAMRQLIGLERQAYGVEQDEGGEKPYEERLKELAQKPA